MQTYKEYRPTGFDMAGLGLPDHQTWLVAIGRNRDSGALERANFAAFEREIAKIDSEGTDHEVHRFGHWACGWLEVLIVKPETPAAKEAQSFLNALSDYPVLDDELYSQYEHEEFGLD